MEPLAGSAFCSLFILLFWDIIFDCTIPYVFQTPYQDAPLDLTTEMFYISRKSAIDARLNLIYFSTRSIEGPSRQSPVIRLLEEHYYKWHGRSARGMDWSRWKYDDLKDIAVCLGGPVLALLCERFATDFRFTHSGLPDLLLWDPATQAAKLVEVKGPGDSLSEKQIIWIDALARRGCNIVTLYVKKEEDKKKEEAKLDKFGDEVSELSEAEMAVAPVTPRRRAKKTSPSSSTKKKKAKEVEEEVLDE